MSTQNYDGQKIIEYLLGALPEAEAERFDELSFTDDEFADLLALAEKDLVDAYARGELDGATLEKFKSHYLASPLRREKVQFAEAFQIFTDRRVGKTGGENAAAEEIKAERSAPGLFSGIKDFIALRPLLSRGAAAVCLISIVFAGFWIFSRRSMLPESEVVTKPDSTLPSETGVRQTPRQVEAGGSESAETEKEVAAANKEAETSLQNNARGQTNKPPAAPRRESSPKLPKNSIASFVLAPPLRRADQIPTLSVPSQAETIAMRLQLESDDYTAYRVALIDQADKSLWSSGRVKIKSAGAQKTLDVHFPARLLKSQIYSLAVSGVKADGEAEVIINYPFRAVLK